MFARESDGGFQAGILAEGGDDFGVAAVVIGFLPFNLLFREREIIESKHNA